MKISLAKILASWLVKKIEKWPLVGKRNWPLKLVLDAQSVRASSLNIIKQFHIFQSCCSQTQEGQNQILQSLHFCRKSQGKAIRKKFKHSNQVLFDIPPPPPTHTHKKCFTCILSNNWNPLTFITFSPIPQALFWQYFQRLKCEKI